MITRIELHNFMSHACTVIEPAAGLTVLVGPNNCGKSAAVSALQIVCENDRGDYMVRHGEDECRIVVVTDDGHRVEWRRKKAVVSYTIDGEDVYRLQGDVPADLHKVLRLPKVEGGDGRDYDIHFGCQKSPIFLLNEPGSRAATFFASSSDASKLVEMQARHRQKGTQARRDEARLSAQIEARSRRLQVLEPVGDLERATADAARRYVALTDLQSRLNTLREDRDSIEQNVRELAKLEAESDALGRLESPPRLSDTASLEDTIQLGAQTSGRIATEAARIEALRALAQPPALEDPAHIGEIAKRLQYWASRRAIDEATLAALKELSLPPRIEDLQPVEALCAGIAACEAQRAAFCSQESSLVPLSGPPHMADGGPLAALIEGVEISGRLVMKAEERARVLADVSEPPALRDERPLQELISELDKAHTDTAELGHASVALDALVDPPGRVGFEPLIDVITQMEQLEESIAGPLQDDLSEAGERLDAIIAELRQWATATRVCPTCGVELDAERIERFVTSGAGKHRHG